MFLQDAAPDRQITRYNREGKILGTVGEAAKYQGLALSPDGTQLAVSKSSGQTSNIWLLDLSRGGAGTQFTFGSARDESPVWSPDGKQIIFRSDRDGSYNLYQKPVNGLKDEEVLLPSNEGNGPRVGRATGVSCCIQ